MNESEKKPLSKSALAKALPCAKSLLSRGRFKTMPKFYSVEEFKIWEAQTRMRGTAPWGDPEPVPVVEAVADPHAPVVHAPKVIKVDWSKFDTSDADHLDVTLNRAERVSNMAYALLESAVEQGDIAATFGAIKNWSNALKEAAVLRGDLLALQKEERRVIDLDEVMHVVGSVVQEWMIGIESALARGAARANPSDPALALQVYQSEFDLVKSRIQESMDRISEELGVDEEAEEEMVCHG